MSSMLFGKLGTGVLVYLDDIIVIGDSLSDHIANLTRPLFALRRHGLKIKAEKCVPRPKMAAVN